MTPLKAGDIAPKFSLPDRGRRGSKFNRLPRDNVSGLFLPESHDPGLHRPGVRLAR